MIQMMLMIEFADTEAQKWRFQQEILRQEAFSITSLTWPLNVTKLQDFGKPFSATSIQTSLHCLIRSQLCC